MAGVCFREKAAVRPCFLRASIFPPIKPYLPQGVFHPVVPFCHYPQSLLNHIQLSSFFRCSYFFARSSSRIDTVRANKPISSTPPPIINRLTRWSDMVFLLKIEFGSKTQVSSSAFMFQIALYSQEPGKPLLPHDAGRGTPAEIEIGRGNPVIDDLPVMGPKSP